MTSATAVPVLTPDPDLPVSACAEQIATAISHHQVVVIAGETGSGKTTQLPKICLAAGRQSIGHTQPRRIAARSVAERIAAETETEIGDLVGYQMRFNRRTSRSTKLKVMTDGVLLAEISHDRDLRKYDTIIIDEAHERSLNIDFLLGYLKQLLPRRPELRVIITSATIDTERFSEHFDGAPVIEVSGRTYPVEVRYRPSDAAAGEVDPLTQISDAVVELFTEDDGDILIFLAGEREIRDTADVLTALQLPGTEILPLYSRLSAADQHRIFARHSGRRIVLATNIAETSLTVPGITSVIDPGTARISRYSTRTKVQRLPIEAISQASANQRAGRSGRTSPGICIRLYSEDDFESRPAFTEPEMLRTNLASVILQMTAAGLGNIASFPFVEPPDSGAIGDGLRLLRELGALHPKSTKSEVRLSEVGRRLARMPLDPRLGRMLIAAERNDCLAETMIIVAGLSGADPRERPADHADRASELHRRFWSNQGWARDQESTANQTGPPRRGADQRRHDRSASQPDRAQRTEASRKSSGRSETVRRSNPEGGPASDFLSWLHLWRYLGERQRELSGNAFRRLCRDEFLHFLRIREWQELHSQLRDVARDLKLTVNSHPAADDQIHSALLSGLLSNIGLLEVVTSTSQGGAARSRRRGPREYLGARGAKFAINPGSALARTPPQLVMAAELVETGRLWARTVGAVDADQVEVVGEHLLSRSWSEPHFSARRGAVMARERSTLLGVPIRTDQVVGYGTIDPVRAREIFIRSGLVDEELRTRLPFLQHNRAVRAEASELATRLRRPELDDDELIFDFYDQRIPAEVASGRHLESWFSRQDDRSLLDLQVEDLVADHAELASFPDRWSIGKGQELEVRYVFAPGSGHDGVTVVIPLDVLHRIPTAPFTWQVPGLRRELAVAMIKSLPKSLRTSFVPAPDHADQALAELAHHDAELGTISFPAALAEALSRRGTRVEPGDFDSTRIPDRLRLGFAVITDDGEVTGFDLATLQQQLTGAVEDTLTAAAAVTDRSLTSGQTTWTFADIPSALDDGAGGYPGLFDEGSSVGLRVYADPDRAAREHRRAVVRLLALTTPDPVKWVTSRLSNPDKLALLTGPYPSLTALIADARLRGITELANRAFDPATVRDSAAFQRLAEQVRPDAAPEISRIVAGAAHTLRASSDLQQALAASSNFDEAVADVAEQLKNLVFDGFLGVTAEPWLSQLPRYLRAATLRLQALPGSAARDQRGIDEIWPLEQSYAELMSSQPDGPLNDAVISIGWQLEELRVSLFAQSLGTRMPVSAKRIRAAMAALPVG